MAYRGTTEFCWAYHRASNEIKGVVVWADVGYNAKAPLFDAKINTDVYRRIIPKPLGRWAKEHYGVNRDGRQSWKQVLINKQAIYNTVRSLESSDYPAGWSPSHTSFREDPGRFRVPTQIRNYIQHLCNFTLSTDKSLYLFVQYVV